MTAPSPGAQHEDRRALADLVADLDQHLADGARDGAGTSIVALSDSSVSSGSSALTLSPGATCTSMIGTSLKSPMSGTGTSTWLAVVSSSVYRAAFARSGAGGVGLVRVDAVAGDRLGRPRRRDRALRGQRGQRGDGDVVAVDLEVPAQVAR